MLEFIDVTERVLGHALTMADQFRNAIEDTSCFAQLPFSLKPSDVHDQRHSRGQWPHQHDNHG